MCEDRTGRDLIACQSFVSEGPRIHGLHCKATCCTYVHVPIHRITSGSQTIKCVLDCERNAKKLPKKYKGIFHSFVIIIR